MNPMHAGRVHSRALLTGVAATLLAACGASPRPHASACDRSGPLLDDTPAMAVPGGLVARDGQLAYLASPAGGIDVVDLATGSTLVRLDGGDAPLALGPGYLVASRSQDNAAQVVLLDVRAGCEGVVRISDPVRGPKAETWIAAAERAAASVLLVRWTSASPPTGIDAGRPVEGQSLVDLRTGRVTGVDRPGASVIGAARDDRYYPWADGLQGPRPLADGWLGALRVVSGAIVFELVPGGERRVVIADPAAPWGYVQVWVTAGGGHLAVMETNHEEIDGSQPGTRGRARVVSIESGETVVELAGFYQGPGVVAGNLFLVAPAERPSVPVASFEPEAYTTRLLDAYELGASRLRWRRLVRDGLAPPAVPPAPGSPLPASGVSRARRGPR